jgi:TonB-dependent SusC/RagA subfamily outer membrane receptor
MKRLPLVLGMVLFVVSFALAQRTVTGTVLDDQGEALIGANILVKGTAVGASTDFDGKYQLEVPEGSDVLVVSYTGYETQEITLGVSDIVDITMSEGVTLSEAVVTALGISREDKSIGYAVQEVDGEKLAQTKETNIVNSLNGQVAGVQIQGAPSTLGGSSRITIRGSNSFLGENQPLFVIDGVPIDNSGFARGTQQSGFGPSTAYDYGNTAQDIDPNSVAKMTVLKGAAATALYGQRGANGVILITTKDGAGQGKGLGITVNSAVTFDPGDQPDSSPASIRGWLYWPVQLPDSPSLRRMVQSYLAPAYAKDGAWGPRYDPNVQVRHWDSWDPASPNYKETRPWVAPDEWLRGVL